MSESFAIQEAPADYRVMQKSPRVKAGYKQTEVGVIPEDWDVKLIGQCLKIRHGKNQADVVCANGEYPILGTGGEMGRASRPLYSKSSVLIGRKGTIDVPRYLETPFWTVDTLFYSEIAEGVSPKFIFYQFCLIDWYSYNEASGVPSLNAKTIENIQLSVPSLHEQRAIATALSDVDALLAAQDKLIAKKRDIKQATMQQLLTGKQRLPGFQVNPGYKQTEVGIIPEDWNVKLLPEVCRFRGGKAHEQYISEYGEFVCVNSKFISTDGVVRKYSTSNFCCANQNDVLMVMSDLPNGRALAKAYLVEQGGLYAVNQRVCALTAYSDCPKFLFYTLNRNPYFLKFNDGVSQTHLLNGVFAACPIILPQSQSEQSAIANVLSDMEADLTALEQQRDKTRTLKQGMMQELLTGRIRLV